MCEPCSATNATGRDPDTIAVQLTAANEIEDSNPGSSHPTAAIPRRGAHWAHRWQQQQPGAPTGLACAHLFKESRRVARDTASPIRLRRLTASRRGVSALVKSQMRTSAMLPLVLAFVAGAAPCGAGLELKATSNASAVSTLSLLGHASPMQDNNDSAIGGHIQRQWKARPAAMEDNTGGNGQQCWRH